LLVVVVLLYQLNQEDLAVDQLLVEDVDRVQADLSVELVRFLAQHLHHQLLVGFPSNHFHQIVHLNLLTSAALCLVLGWLLRLQLTLLFHKGTLDCGLDVPAHRLVYCVKTLK